MVDKRDIEFRIWDWIGWDIGHRDFRAIDGCKSKG